MHNYQILETLCNTYANNTGRIPLEKNIRIIKSFSYHEILFLQYINIIIMYINTY